MGGEGRGRKRGSVFKEEEERASPACSFKSDKCAVGNMTEKNNAEECVLETRGRRGRGGGLVVDRGASEESKN